MELLYNYLKYITLLFIYAKKLKLILKNICTNKFIFVRFTRGTSQKQHKYPSVDEWIRVMVYLILKHGMLSLSSCFMKAKNKVADKNSRTEVY